MDSETQARRLSEEVGTEKTVVSGREDMHYLSAAKINTLRFIIVFLILEA